MIEKEILNPPKLFRSHSLRSCYSGERPTVADIPVGMHTKCVRGHCDMATGSS